MIRRWHEWGVFGANAPRTEAGASTAPAAIFLRSSAPSRAAGLIGQAVGDAIETLLIWQSRGRTRRELASLNDQMLHDIGITRADVDREYSKPIWRS